MKEQHYYNVPGSIMVTQDFILFVVSSVPSHEFRVTVDFKKDQLQLEKSLIYSTIDDYRLDNDLIWVESSY